MNSAIAKQLIELNRSFYDQFGHSFSATRQRLQPGVQRILALIREDDAVLDLGCGNGHFLHALHQRAHEGALLGADFSLPLLRDAVSRPGVKFREVDLTKPSAFSDVLAIQGGWDVIAMFATLHHIPSNKIRLDVLKSMKQLLKVGGRFILSNWQFLNSEKLKARIQPWSRLELSNQDVDEGDYLLDWRSGGEGLRYAHHFSVEELIGLAAQVGMGVSESFLSDGENGRLGLYQIWTHV